VEGLYQEVCIPVPPDEQRVLHMIQQCTPIDFDKALEDLQPGAPPARLLNANKHLTEAAITV
jgi:hypothetical protein